MALRLGVAPSWLRGEAKAGRIPHLDASGTFLFDPKAVYKALADLAAGKERTVPPTPPRR